MQGCDTVVLSDSTCPSTHSKRLNVASNRDNLRWHKEMMVVNKSESQRRFVSYVCKCDMSFHVTS